VGRPERRAPQQPGAGVVATVATVLRTLYGRAPEQPSRRVGHDAAGRVLATMVLALVLAALVNADALVERAEEKPFGPGRDRSLAIWHPVQDLAHVLQLHRIRDVADAIAGEEDGGGSGSVGGSAAAPSTSTTVTVPPRPVVRVPTAEAPLRVWVGGDSMMRDLATSVERLAAPDPLLDVTPHYEISSGLTRPDYFDWPAALRDDMERIGPEVVILMLGANDAQGIVTADGTVFQQVSDAGWQAEYALRVAATMDLLRAEGRLVYWVSQPPMQDSGFDGRMDVINGITREAAASRPWVEYVDTAGLLGGADGAFTDRTTSADGEVLDLRQGDGIHLARDGADLLAAHLLALVADEIDGAPTSGG
jgi:lysophospholipase L1-like esterase